MMRKFLYCCFIVSLFFIVSFNTVHAMKNKFSDHVYNAIKLKASQIEIDEAVLIDICEDSCDIAESAEDRTKPLYRCVKDYAIYVWLKYIGADEITKIKTMKDFSEFKHSMATRINMLSIHQFNEFYAYLTAECRYSSLEKWRDANKKADDMVQTAKKQEIEFINTGFLLTLPKVEVLITTLIEQYTEEVLMENFLFYREDLKKIIHGKMESILISYYFMQKYPSMKVKSSVEEEYKLMVEVINKSYEVLSNENVITTSPKGPALVVGDLHGNIFALAKCIRVAKDELSSGRVNSVIFLGDYIDRGFHSIEVIERLLNLKLEFPDKIFLLRGNHENIMIDPNTFVAELNKNFGLKYGSILCDLFYKKLFPMLPVAAQISLDDGKKVFCAHAGFPDPFKSEEMELFSRLKKLTTKEAINRDEFKTIINSMLWNDPFRSDSTQIFRGNFSFTKEHIEAFLRLVECDYLVRGHEFVRTGFLKEFDGLCYTIFSSTDYFDSNFGVIAQISNEGIRPFARILSRDIEKLV